MTLLFDRAATFGASLRGSATTLATDQVGQTFTPTPDRYDLAERYYANSFYERSDAGVGAIKAWYGLNRNIRPVLSLVKPAVDWWPNTLFGGVWTHDGLPASDGQPNILNYDADTEEAVRLAIQTAYTWANGGAEIPAQCRKMANIGDGFGEVAVDYVRQKAYPKFVHPTFVTNVEWNDSGDVIEYTIEIPREDGNVRYLWGKTVTKETITTLKDGKPHGYNEQPAIIDNPWGFVPADWAMHVNVGGQHGAGVFDALYPVLDELCSAVGSSIDYINKFVHQDVLIETTDTAGAKRTVDASTKRGPTSDFTDLRTDRESLRVRFVPPGTKVHRLLEDMGLDSANPHIDRLINNLYTNVPELTIDEKIAEMSVVSKPGGMVIAAPMQRRVNGVFGNEAQFIRKLGQMSASINGEMLNRGVWGRGGMTEAQRRFLPFTLQSYDRGELDVSFVTPKLISPTMAELAAEAATVERLTTVWGFRHSGLGNGDLYGVDASGTPNQAPADIGIIGAKEQAKADEAFAAATIFNGGGPA